MKILAPISGRLDLAVSAAAAVLVHAAALGLGLGSFARAPAPKLQQVERNETVSLLPPAPRPRERVKAIPRERVQEEREALEPVERTPERSPARSPAEVSREPLARAAMDRRKSPRPRARERAPAPERLPTREKILRERVEPSPEPRGRQERALLRTAAPRVRKGFAFNYPRFARLMGYEGRVTLRVTVSAEGRVKAVEVAKSSGYRILDESAARQMKSVPFAPALDPRGRPVESTVIQSVNFDIKEGGAAEYEW